MSISSLCLFCENDEINQQTLSPLTTGNVANMFRKAWRARTGCLERFGSLTESQENRENHLGELHVEGETYQKMDCSAFISCARGLRCRETITNLELKPTQRFVDHARQTQIYARPEIQFILS